jgi:seryl-tRNA synthetase
LRGYLLGNLKENRAMKKMTDDQNTRILNAQQKIEDAKKKANDQCARTASKILNAHQDIEDVFNTYRDISDTLGAKGDPVLLTAKDFKALQRANGVIGREIVKLVPG